MHTPSTAAPKSNVEPNVIRLLRHAYALGWRDRVEVETAIREGALVPVEGREDADPPCPDTEDFLSRLLAAAY